MKYCRNCGHELMDNDNFCPKCGTNQNTGMERRTQMIESSLISDTKVIIHRDRSKWQGFLALGSGLLGVFLSLLLVALSIYTFWFGVLIAMIPTIFALIIIVATVSCFVNFKSRMINKDLAPECIFFEDNGSVSVVDLRGVVHNLPLDELKIANTGVIGRRGSCYVKLPIAQRGYKTLFCGYCKEELDLSKVENVCR